MAKNLPIPKEVVEQSGIYTQTRPIKLYKVVILDKHISAWYAKKKGVHYWTTLFAIDTVNRDSVVFKVVNYEEGRLLEPTMILYIRPCDCKIIDELEHRQPIGQ